jgi:hypothetical protein
MYFYEIFSPSTPSSWPTQAKVIKRSGSVKEELFPTQFWGIAWTPEYRKLACEKCVREAMTQAKPRGLAS